MSPVARLAYQSDAISRYFFNEHEIFGRWSFQGGSIAGEIQKSFLVPLMRRLGKAAHVNVQAISGLSGMTVALSALGGKIGETVLTVPAAHGGHPATSFVAERLGFRVEPIPFQDWAIIDMEQLAALLDAARPSLVYFDHPTALYPISIAQLAEVVHAVCPATLLHVDSSHVNGLIWGGVLPNPLECGADSYGGSTHKTFPGPHKAVLMTNSEEISERITMAAIKLISHQHLASTIALAITALEFETCGGREYAQQIVRNAAALASSLARRGVAVHLHESRPPEAHQVWFSTQRAKDAFALGESLFSCGIIVNPYDPLPATGGPAIRVGVNEPTRLGLREDDMAILAGWIAQVTEDPTRAAGLAKPIGEFRRGFAPRFCYDRNAYLELSDALFDSGGSACTAIERFLYR